MFIVILTVIGVMPHLNAANFNFKFLRKPSYEQVGGIDETDPQLKKLLNQVDLTVKQRKDLANLCLIDPFHCCDKSITQRVSVNEVLDNGETFAYALYRQAKAVDGSGIAPMRKQYSNELFRTEVILQPNLNFHYRKNTADDFDLALDILRSDDKYLIKQMMRNSGFDPNSTYGSKQYVLATMLILDKNMDALLLLLKHSKFDCLWKDLDLLRPAYYLLKNYKELPEKELIKALLGPNLNEWDLRCIGLSEPDLFDLLFQQILENDIERKIIFKKIIAQLLLWNEGIRNDENIQDSLRRAFTNGTFEYKIFISVDFTQSALGELKKYTGLNLIAPFDFCNKELLGNSAGNDIPGLAQCPKCQKIMVLNTENPKVRILNCKCDAKYLIGSRAEGGLLPLDIFINPGQCSSCGTIVDLEDAGNREINCTNCNQKSTWRPLEY